MVLFVIVHSGCEYLNHWTHSCLADHRLAFLWHCRQISNDLPPRFKFQLPLFFVFIRLDKVHEHPQVPLARR